ncbi:MAG: class I SAM-dependent methyltransferase [Halioglobus sp.]|nr:class I SAM-dependent methyltransferase [Halioglobus sp.]
MKNRFSLSDLDKIYSTHWKKGYGSIAKSEVLFLQKLIEEYRPQNFIEVGMASGISGGSIAQMLDWCGAKTFTSIDYDNTFFGDPTKPNGFLIEKIYQGNNIEVAKLPFTTTLDLSSIGAKFDMGFIDANHQHPWPLIDTLLLYPFLTSPKILIHHDLKLFRRQDVVYGIGPKYLFDQFPERYRITTIEGGQNIFALDMSEIGVERLKNIAMDAFSLPWSLRSPLDQSTISGVAKNLENVYGSDLKNLFLKSTGKFNPIP